MAAKTCGAVLISAAAIAGVAYALAKYEPRFGSMARFAYDIALRNRLAPEDGREERLLQV